MNKKKLITISLIVGAIIMVTKFIAYFVTRSNIILTDATESIINVVASAFALYSIYLGALPKDKNHPYGHGKIEFFAAGFEGGLIMLTGFFIIVKSVFNFFQFNEPQNLGSGIIMMSATTVVNFALAFPLLKEGVKSNSVILEAEGKHLLNDNLTTLMGISGLLIVHVTGNQVLDSVFSIVLASAIIYNGYKIVRPSIGGLMDEADINLIDSIRNVFTKHRCHERIDIHNLRVQKYGSDLHIDCHVTIPFYFSLQQTHDIVHDIELELRNEFKQQVEIFIHADPCIHATNCAICSMENCRERKYNFVKKLEWTNERLMKNEKHTL